MGIASLILGIISVLFALIPGCGLFLAPFPALIGLGLGIADWVGKGKRGESKGVGIAGTVISALAFVVLGGWIALAAAQKPEGMTYREWIESKEAEAQKAVEEVKEQAEKAEAGATPQGTN